jgi:pimeloyl-ACP methyl ester carboxylesterase
LEHPESVSKLVLIAAGISGVEPPDDLVKQWDAQDAAFAAGDLEGLIEMELVMWVDGPNRTPEQSPAAVRAKIRAMELDNLKIDTDGFKSAPLDPPAANRLGEIRVPTLVIVGTGDQPHVVETARTLVRGIPRAQELILEGIGHVPSMEKPEVINRTLEEFLKSA